MGKPIRPRNKQICFLDIWTALHVLDLRNYEYNCQINSKVFHRRYVVWTISFRLNQAILNSFSYYNDAHSLAKDYVFAVYHTWNDIPINKKSSPLDKLTSILQ